VRFTKMHGTGNDFVVIDGTDAAGRARTDDEWARLARAMDDRHFGVGGDGIIVALPSELAALRMRMFNPDGSEAEMCGNGIRCLAKFAAERGLVEAANDALSVETGAGLLTCRLLRDGDSVAAVRVSMGRPRLDPREIPVLAEQAPPVRNFPIEAGGVRYEVTCVSMGNPHAVLFTHAPVDEFPLDRTGPLVEHLPAFPRRVNFEVVNVVSHGRLRARVWERGAGLTFACGTGACAIAVAARLNGLTGDSTEVSLPGGMLQIDWDGDGEVFLTGPAVEVFEGEWPAS
jgi:diaminopimelate epimerase